MPNNRVLVLMPTQLDAERTRALLSEAGIPSIACQDITDLCKQLVSGAGALLLTEEVVRTGDAGQLIEALREQPLWSAVPVVLIAREGRSRNEHTSVEVFRNLIVVERPVRTRTLLSVVLSALRGRRHQYQIRDASLVREQQAAELMAQDERLRFALSAGGLGSWDLDLAADELICSDICLAHYGRQSSSRITYKDLHDAVHHDDRERVSRTIARSVATHSDLDIEHRVVWPRGEIRWLLVRGRATYDANGEALRMAGVSLDVTERKRMHEALRQSESELARQAEELRRAGQRKDEFLATLAHELRNPLAPIRTGLELMRRAPAGDSAQRALPIMQRQLGHMVRLIDDLLDVSRITRGKLELMRERIALRSVIEAAVEGSQTLIEERRHTLTVSLPGKPVVLDVDPTRIAQVISNLLNNASNYTPPGGQITLTAKLVSEEVQIEVKDTGLGIPHDRLDDVFEMFSQVNHDLERTARGLGIGLALVRSLVELHGGTVAANSAGLGQGSTFTLRLPRAAGEAQLVSEAPQEAAPETLKRRILVVDDNEDAADLLALMLQHSGYDTSIAHDGAAAIALVEAWSPEVVILDIGLPGRSGHDVARELRQDRRYKDLGLIALTGWGTREDKQRAIDAGFDVHLTKPVDPRDLQTALAHLSNGAS